MFQRTAFFRAAQITLLAAACLVLTPAVRAGSSNSLLDLSPDEA